MLACCRPNLHGWFSGLPTSDGLQPKSDGLQPKSDGDSFHISLCAKARRELIFEVGMTLHVAPSLQAAAPSDGPAAELGAVDEAEFLCYLPRRGKRMCSITVHRY